MEKIKDIIWGLISIISFIFIIFMILVIGGMYGIPL